MTLTFLLASIGIVSLAGVAVFLRSQRMHNERKQELLDTVKRRAEKKMFERAFADTQPMNEPFVLEMEHIPHAEVLDYYDQTGDITPEQRDVINAIFGGDPVDFKEDRDHNRVVAKVLANRK